MYWKTSCSMKYWGPFNLCDFRFPIHHISEGILYFYLNSSDLKTFKFLLLYISAPVGQIKPFYPWIMRISVWLLKATLPIWMMCCWTPLWSVVFVHLYTWTSRKVTTHTTLISCNTYILWIFPPILCCLLLTKFIWLSCRVSASSNIPPFFSSPMPRALL